VLVPPKAVFSTAPCLLACNYLTQVSRLVSAPAPSHVSLFAGRLCSPESGGDVSLPAVARPWGPDKPCPAPGLSGVGEQEGVRSSCRTRAGALQVLGWDHLGAGTRLAGAALTTNFLCPQRGDRAHRHLHRLGLPPEDGEGCGEGGCVSLCAEAAGAAGQHGADRGEESYLLPAHCQAADLLPTLLRDVAKPYWQCRSWSSHRDWSCQVMETAGSCFQCCVQTYLGSMFP